MKCIIKQHFREQPNSSPVHGIDYPRPHHGDVERTTGWGLGSGVKIAKQFFTTTSKIADLGCGNGWFEEQMKNYKISAVDYPQYDFNVDELPYEDSSLDGAVAFQVIEHLENPHHFVREVRRVMKKGGVFICATPNPFHIYNKLTFLRKGEHYRYNRENDHRYVASKSIFDKLFRDFSQKSHFFRGGVFPYRVFARFKYPENELFGQDICWILTK